MHVFVQAPIIQYAFFVCALWGRQLFKICEIRLQVVNHWLLHQSEWTGLSVMV